MQETSTKPYLLRAIYEWCTDNGYTPYLTAWVDAWTQVPREFVKNDEIVLNISFSATSGLKMDNDLIHFHARFGGVSREVSIPVENVMAIYARENGQGMAFEIEPSSNLEEDAEEPVDPHVAEHRNTPPILSAVPSGSSTPSSTSEESDPDDDPNPPKKGAKPTLTRVK